MFKKKKKTANTPIQSKATAWKPFTINICLLNKITETSPSPSDELELLQAGLGKRTITVSSNMNHSELCKLLEAEFPKMRSLAGGWLLYKAPGGSGRRRLTVVPPDSEGYTGSLIKMATTSGKTALYMVPLQDELCLDPLPFSAEEFVKMPKVECRTCQTTMPLPVLYMHVKSCGGTQSADDNEITGADNDDDDEVKIVAVTASTETTATPNPTFSPTPTTPLQTCSPAPTTSYEEEGQCPICLEIFTQRQLLIHASICGDSPDDVLKLLASRVDNSKDFKICVSRTDFFQRAMVQWQRQKKGTPGNTLRVTFLGEAGVDSGAIRKEFLTDLIGEIEKRLFEHQGHQSGKSPIYSLSDLEKGYFRTAGEVFTVSLAQGGPAPRFLRQWCFDYLSAGDLDEANLTKDDVDDAELFELIQKVEEETDLSAWTNDIISCGYTGLIKPDNKEAIIRSIVLHATLRLIPLLKQLRKGLQVYNFVDILQDHCGLCQHFFVPTAVDDDNEADADFIMQNILPKLSEKGTMREAREMAIVNFLQDFLQEIESADDISDGDTLPLTVPRVMQWLTGQGHKPLLMSERQEFKIALHFDHDCHQRMPAH
uniref:HECT domain-containing protein n=1 Tax=Cyprinus carpio carpio TaxID=630221 RepID=A0A9J7YT29_CYPCA